MSPALYDLNGLLLQIDSPHPLMARMADYLLGPLTSRRLGKPDWTLRQLASDPDEAPLDPQMQLTASGPLPAGHGARRYDSPGGAVLDVPSQARLTVSFPDRSAEIRWREESSRAAYADCLSAAVCEILNASGQYVLHAAAIAAPTPAGPQLVLLVGRSGTGKTTASLALHGEGWQLLTDDAAFIADGPTVWGLPRPLKVHRNTLKLLPELQAMTEGPPADDEFPLPYEKIAGELVGRALPVAAVVVLGDRSAGDHALTPIDPAEALCQLVERNVAVRDGLRSETAAKAFAAISQTVAAAWAGCYRLNAGNDLPSLRRVIADAIEGSANV
jgi:hypothetical protein